MVKIYFAGSIRGGRADVNIYYRIIEHLKKYGEVLTEHVGDSKITDLGEPDLSKRQIHDRDLEWLLSSDVLVAEVTSPSLGVGYEISMAVQNNKKVLCLHCLPDDKKLSGMISGCPQATKFKYENIEHAKQIIDEYFRTI